MPDTLEMSHANARIDTAARLTVAPSAVIDTPPSVTVPSIVWPDACVIAMIAIATRPVPLPTGTLATVGDELPEA